MATFCYKRRICDVFAGVVIRVTKLLGSMCHVHDKCTKEALEVWQLSCDVPIDLKIA